MKCIADEAESIQELDPGQSEDILLLASGWLKEADQGCTTWYPLPSFIFSALEKRKLSPPISPNS